MLVCEKQMHGSAPAEKSTSFIALNAHSAADAQEIKGAITSILNNILRLVRRIDVLLEAVDTSHRVQKWYVNKRSTATQELRAA